MTKVRQDDIGASGRQAIFPAIGLHTR